MSSNTRNVLWGWAMAYACHCDSGRGLETVRKATTAGNALISAMVLNAVIALSSLVHHPPTPHAQEPFNASTPLF